MTVSQSLMAAGQVEIWAGIECTVNRVGDQFFDQCARNGHASRESDLELFAGLGVRRLRYPILWETSQRTVGEGENGSDYDFTWAAPRIDRLFKLGVEPIAGLLHHGSGPRSTSLVDPGFPEAFARYARAVAERFPMIRDYTPINEPLTTARFSGLYGVWYPHGRDNPTFLRALINECKATVLAMREIRAVRPDARLVQTDDMGRASGTEPLSAQVAFENERRWLGYDLLFGRVNRGHALRGFLLDNGISERELDWFVDNPCPPDVIGINHYPLSNRFLDHRVELFPAHFHGHNGEMAYADVGTPQAIELHPEDPHFVVIPPEEILREVCDRYDADVAVTEVHVDGPREAQMRWLNLVWESACRLANEGKRIRAVTVWSLLGSFDWNCLVSECRWYYESGVFDIRAPQPRPTGLAQMTRDLVSHGRCDHPVLTKAAKRTGTPASSLGTPFLILGSGFLAQALARAAAQRSLEYVLATDLQNCSDSKSALVGAFKHMNPWAVIDATETVGVESAESNPHRADEDYSRWPTRLAEVCREMKLPFMAFSSDLVLGAEGGSRPFVESSVVAPINAFGRSKAEMERRVLEIEPKSLVIRSGLRVNSWSDRDWVARVLRLLSAGTPVQLPGGQIRSAVYLPDLVHTALDLMIDGQSGVVHLVNQGETSLPDLARLVARVMSVDENLIDEAVDATLAPRPRYSALGSERLSVMAPLEDALRRSRLDFVQEGFVDALN